MLNLQSHIPTSLSALISGFLSSFLKIFSTHLFGCWANYDFNRYILFRKVCPLNLHTLFFIYLRSGLHCLFLKFSFVFWLLGKLFRKSRWKHHMGLFLSSGRNSVSLFNYLLLISSFSCKLEYFMQWPTYGLIKCGSEELCFWM